MTQWIESDANPKVKRWKKLAHDVRAIRKEGFALAEGVHLGESLLNAGAGVRSIILSEAAKGEARDCAAALADALGIDTFVLPERLYAQIDTVEAGSGLTCEFALPYKDEAPLTGDVLYLDGVQDAGNVGTLIRTAVAAGVKTIAGSSATAAFYSPKVLRAGMGAHFGARLIENVALKDLLTRFEGLVCAADARGGEDLFKAADYGQGNVLWIMGAEGAGVSEAALALADKRFYIPIEPACESLNVAAAAAVCLFDLRRRRASR